ncbi:MAG: DMT family transporter [Methanococcaceae archaeon]
MTTNKNQLGFFILLIAAFFFSLIGVFSKFIGASFEPFYQAWTRGFITLVIFIGFGLVKKQYVKIEREDLKWFLINGAVASLAVAPTFYSFAFLHLGTALFIQYASIVLVSYLLGTLLLKERLTKVAVAAFLLSIIGLVLVFWGEIRLGSLVPTLAAIASGSFFSIYFVVSKKISSKYSSTEINTFGCVLIVVVNLALSLLLHENFNKHFLSIGWLANIGSGIAWVASTGLTILGFKFIEANRGSIVLLSEILFGLLFGFVLFGETLGTTALIGGLLIFISALLPNVQSIFLKENTSVEILTNDVHR